MGFAFDFTIMLIYMKQYLNFMCTVEGVHTFVFEVLPFGLSTACYFFTKL